MQKITSPTLPSLKPTVTLPESAKRVVLFLNLVKNVTIITDDDGNISRDSNGERILVQIDKKKNKGNPVEFNVSVLNDNEVMYVPPGSGFGFNAAIRVTKNGNDFTFELYSTANNISSPVSAFYANQGYAITEVWAE